MIINHNLNAMNAQRMIAVNTNSSAKSMQKLSSGLRINSAADDAAGLAISEKMRGQIRGLDQASRNSQDAISLIQTAEGALNETHSILQRMRELAVQASNDTNTVVDRGAIKDELSQLTDEIDKIANTTEFNSQKLLDGSKKGLVAPKETEYALQNNSKANLQVSGGASSTGIGESFTVIITRTKGTSGTGSTADFKAVTVGATQTAVVATGSTITYSGETITLEDATAGGSDDLLKLSSGESITISVKRSVKEETDYTKALSMQIGANSGQQMLLGINSMKADALGIRDSDGDSLNISNTQYATASITQINNAIEQVSAERSKLGSYQNRLEHTIANLGTSSENLTSSESRIRDVDMAKEMVTFSKNNILSQAAQAMLSQANQQPQGVLQLLR